MSDAISALNGASYQGFATIREIGPLGMITFLKWGHKKLRSMPKTMFICHYHLINVGF